MAAELPRRSEGHKGNGFLTKRADFAPAKFDWSGHSRHDRSDVPGGGVCSGMGDQQNLASFVDRHRYSETARFRDATAAPERTQALGAQGGGSREQGGGRRQEAEGRRQSTLRRLGRS